VTQPMWMQIEREPGQRPSSAGASPRRNIMRRSAALIVASALAAVLVWLSGPRWPTAYIARILPDEDDGALLVLANDERAWILAAAPNLRPRWRVELDDATTGTVEHVVVGSGMVAVRYVPVDGRPFVRAHRLDSGERVWEEPADFDTVPFRRATKIYEGLLFQFGFIDGEVSVTVRDVDTGAQLWQTTVPYEVESVHERDGLWYFRGNRRIVAFEPASGALVDFDFDSRSSESHCMDDDRFFVARRSDLVLRDAGTSGSARHAWALPSVLRGAPLVRCGRYAEYDVLTFARNDMFDLQPERFGSQSADPALPRERSASRVALLFIDRARREVDGVLDLTGPIGGAVAVALVDGCADHVPAMRCPLNGELTRFVPISTQVHTTSDFGNRVWLLDLDEPTLVGWRDAGTRDAGNVAIHRDDVAYAVVDADSHRLMVIDGQQGGIDQWAYRSARRMQTSRVFGGHVWLAVDQAASLIDLESRSVTSTHAGGVGLEHVSEERLILAERPKLSASDSATGDILSLYEQTSRVAAGGEDERLGRFIHVEPGAIRDALGDGEAHVTVLTRPYLMMQHLVNRAQWEAVMDPVASPPEDTRHACDDLDCPVISRSFREIMEFANRSSALAGLSPCYDLDHRDSLLPSLRCDGFRVPTPAEWKNAAVAGRGSSADPCELDPETLHALTGPETEVRRRAESKAYIRELMAGFSNRESGVDVDPAWSHAVMPETLQLAECASSTGRDLRRLTWTFEDSLDGLGFRLVRTVSGPREDPEPRGDRDPG
jgi:hypothetical protein